MFSPEIVLDLWSEVFLALAVSMGSALLVRADVCA